MNITPDNIVELKDDEVFVFGSNEAGMHGGGAARLAYEKFGAEYGKGFGLHGHSFAIPTKDKKIETLASDAVKFYVDAAFEYFANNPDLVFLVTEIGCGLAGYEPKDIAPFFREASKLPNVFLPKRFWEVLTIIKMIENKSCKGISCTENTVCPLYNFNDDCEIEFHSECILSKKQLDILGKSIE